jgi:anti-sigma B factor antagonist
MKFSSRREGEVVVFDLQGGLEGGPDSYQIKQAVTDMLADGNRKFLLNLDDVDFVNSTGIGIIASVFSSISNADGVMKICNANEKVSRVMMITKLLEVFDSYRLEEEALKAFQSA